MKLSHFVYCVLLDREAHSPDEMLQRIRPFLDPKKAQSKRASYVNKTRENHRRKYVNKSGRSIPKLKKSTTSPEEIDPQKAEKWLFEKCLSSMERQGIVQKGNLPGGPGGYYLTIYGIEHVKQPQVAGGISSVLKHALLTRGKLI